MKLLMHALTASAFLLQHACAARLHPGLWTSTRSHQEELAGHPRALQQGANGASCPSGVYINELRFYFPIPNEGIFIELAGPADTSLANFNIVQFNADGEVADFTRLPAGAAPLESAANTPLGLQVVPFGTLPDFGGVMIVDPRGFLCDFVSWGATITTSDASTSLPPGVTSFNVGEPSTSNGEEAFGRTDAGPFGTTGPAFMRFDTASPGQLNAFQGVALAEAFPSTSTTAGHNTGSTTGTTAGPNSSGTTGSTTGPNTDSTTVVGPNTESIAGSTTGSTSTSSSCSSGVFVNEIRYQDGTTGDGEFIELAGPAWTDLTGITIATYNRFGFAEGLFDAPPNTVLDGGTSTSSPLGFSVVFSGRLLNEGGVVVLDRDGSVCDFVSWGGSITTEFPTVAGFDAIPVGLQSLDIGLTASETPGPRESFGRIDSGSGTVAPFWVLFDDDATPGQVNVGQVS